MTGYALPPTGSLDPCVGSSILPANILAFVLLFGSESESDYRYVSIYLDLKVVRRYIRDYTLVILHIRYFLRFAKDAAIATCADVVIRKNPVKKRRVALYPRVIPTLFKRNQLLLWIRNSFSAALAE
jgi:hypothetical protein